MKIAILGSTGMLGSMVDFYLQGRHQTTAFVRAGNHSFDAHNADFSVLENFDYVINCIGIIKPFCKDNDPAGVQNAIAVNAQFPWKMAMALKKPKLIQIATDCVYSGSKGDYSEKDLPDALDVYGKTKSLGEVFSSQNFLNIRCSIIGPELKGHLSLLDWFLMQPEGSTLKGFSHHFWNGVTTLQFAELVDKIITENTFASLRATHHTHHFKPTPKLTKAEMLQTFNKVYDRGFKIEVVGDVGPKVDRTLASNFTQLADLYPAKSFEQSVLEMKKFSEGKYVR